MQQRALVLTMEHAAEEKVADAQLRFKQMMIAAHPEAADQIEELFSEEYAPRLSDEELGAIGPMGVDEVEQALADLRSLGFALR